MSDLVLLLDAGNTRLKWAVASAAGMVDQGVVEYADLSSAAATWRRYGIARVVGCNVAGPQVAADLAAAFAPLVPEWLRSSAEQGGLRSSYRQPAQLGSDRWAAMIGARARCAGELIVVMAGTAMTVDAVTAEGAFLGGVIVPGFRLMRQALAQGTAELGLPDGEVVAFPASTGEAIVNGALAALAGAIEEMRRRLESAQGRPATVLISGGDAATIAPLLQARLAERLIPVDNLVLDGLYQLAFPTTAGPEILT